MLVFFLTFLGQKLSRLQLPDFEQIWGFFSVLPIFDRFIQTFCRKFSAQLTRTNLLNQWIFFDFKNYQPFLKYQSRKVKFRRFTSIEIGNERFAAENCVYFFN